MLYCCYNVKNSEKNVQKVGCNLEYNVLEGERRRHKPTEPPCVCTTEQHTEQHLEVGNYLTLTNLEGLATRTGSQTPH